MFLKTILTCTILLILNLSSCRHSENISLNSSSPAAAPTQFDDNSRDGSKLPVRMPGTVEIDYSFNNGGQGAVRTIEIIENKIKYEYNNAVVQTKWSADITNADKEGVYRIFVDNKFDLIKNDPENINAVDASKEFVELKLDGNTSYKIFRGVNTPLSGINLEHYKAALTAVKDLAKKYMPPGKNPQSDSTLPKQMPADTEINLKWSDVGFARTRDIKITGDQLQYEGKESRDVNKMWSATISKTDKEKLYRVFVDNKFDLIDSGEEDDSNGNFNNEWVCLSYGGKKPHGVFLLQLPPLTGDSLEHFQTIAKAIDDLVEKYQASGK